MRRESRDNIINAKRGEGGFVILSIFVVLRHAGLSNHRLTRHPRVQRPPPMGRDPITWAPSSLAAPLALRLNENIFLSFFNIHIYIYN